MIKQILYFVIAAFLFSACGNSSPDKSKKIGVLKKSLMENAAGVADLNDEVSKGESELAAQLIHSYLSAKLQNDYAEQWQNETLELGNKQLKFAYKKFGEKPEKGWSLYISMHGGGGAPAKVNDRQWENQKKLYEPAEGIYMAARAPTDTWNMWHQEHIDEFFGLYIQLADVFEDINTNRVYITGYSAGGDGTFRLAPRMADWFAAGAMMAGHPGDVSPLSLRNLPFTIHMGADDAAYRRNEIAAEWKVKLDDLQKNDSGGYIHDVQIHEGMPHWMQQKDTVAIDWMAQFDRNPYPEKVVWKQDGVTHNRFYWLGVPEGEAQKRLKLLLQLQGSTFKLKSLKW